MVSVEVPHCAREALKRARLGKTPTAKLFAAALWWFAELPPSLRLQIVRAARNDGPLAGK